MKRTFVAVNIRPEDKLRNIARQFRQDLSGDRIKWVDLDGMHITLSFLGDTHEEKIPDLKKVIENVVNDFPILKLEFKGCGIFKNLRDPRVIWFGLEENEILRHLKVSLDQAIEPYGFIPEKREFRPHLTLARIKWIRDISVLKDLIETYEDEHVQLSEVDQVIFYESILRPDGPEYLPLHKSKLVGKT